MDLQIIAFVLFAAGAIVGVILKDYPAALIAAGLTFLNLPK
jgi:hypothetical protein